MRDGIGETATAISDLRAIVRPAVTAKLIWHPAHLRYGEAPGFSDSRIRRYLSYGIERRRWWQIIGHSLYWPAKLWLVPRAGLKWEIFVISSRRDSFWALMVAVAAKLRGVPLTIHDYRFFPRSQGLLYRWLESLGRPNPVEDASDALKSNSGKGSGTETAVSSHLVFYQNFRKERAVPRAIVYGDFEDVALWSRVKRACDLVKQKYPRTEFLIPCMTEPDSDLYRVANESIMVKIIESESDLLLLFEQADILVLLSGGGFNDVFRWRAAAAGYPVIVNGSEHHSSGSILADSIVVSNNNPVTMAEAIIRLVDDDKYYQNFVSSGQIPGK